MISAFQSVQGVVHSHTYHFIQVLISVNQISLEITEHDAQRIIMFIGKLTY